MDDECGSFADVCEIGIEASNVMPDGCDVSSAAAELIVDKSCIVSAFAYDASC
jgi:hypothetical protein